MTEETEVQQALVKMEALDEKQIVENLRGQMITQFFYEFKAGAKPIVGISWAGIKHIASKMMEQGHPISVTDLKVEETEDTYKAFAKAKDLGTNEERWGASEQNKKFSAGERNPFALPLVVSKAQRNAIKQFIPETAIQEGYKEWLAKQSKPIQREATPLPESQVKAPSAPHEASSQWELPSHEYLQSLNWQPVSARALKPPGTLYIFGTNPEVQLLAETMERDPAFQAIVDDRLRKFTFGPGNEGPETFINAEPV